MIEGAQRALGDVEFVIVQLDQDHLSPPLLEALLDHVERGTLRILDVLIVRKLTPAHFRLTEVDPDEFALAGLDLHTPGLICDDDIERILAELPMDLPVGVLVLEGFDREGFRPVFGAFAEQLLATKVIPAKAANEALRSALRQL